jgi:predicted ATPase/DNA-binding winged helix-turn-helix (wHTH) protein
MDGRAISFGPFRLIATQRLLLEGDKPVRLGSRAFDILAALVERAGEVVGKDQLIAHAWPQTFVEEANLKFQINGLRRALGDGQRGQRYIVTVPGRGYNFVAPVQFEEPSRALPPTARASSALNNLPSPSARIIGREQAVRALVSRLSRQRIVTIVGPGGIGKTTVALAVAERMTSAYQHGVWLIDLAPLSDPSLVPSTVATVLGLESRAEDPLQGLVAWLRDSQMLLLLDNCEHLIDAAAGLAGAVVDGAPGVAILATSREPLGVTGERQHRLGPLGSPEPSSGLTAADAAAFPAVELFVERAAAIVEDFSLTDVNAPLVVEICRWLDGLPLAIEFAAPRVEVLGVEGLAARLDSLLLSGTRRRAAVPRHRTMRAVVDWSYGLLSADEQRFLRALAIFSGGFTVEAAAAVTMDAAGPHTDALDRLADLVAKSLIVADISGAEPRFRLLETTRAYAIEKVHASGEREPLRRCHAAYYRTLFERAEAEGPVRPTDEWLADCVPEIDNLRSALDWAFSPGGDGSIGVALTVAAVPLWLRLSLPQECRGRAKQALGALAIDRAPDPRKDMKLHAALFLSPVAAKSVAAFTKVLDIAEQLGDSEYQLRALRGLYFYHAASSRYGAARPFAQRFYDIAMKGSDPNDRLFGERMMGVAKHFLGDQIGARHHLEQVLTHYVATDPGRDVIRFQDVIRFWTDLRMSARVFLARVLWLQGFPDQAVRTSEISLGEAQASGHTMTVCYTLALAACPIALWVGNLAAAAHYASELLHLARRHNLPLLYAFGYRFRNIVVLRGGELDLGSQQPHTSLHDLAEPDASSRFSTGLSELAEALAHAGRIAEGLAVLETGIEQSEAGWLTPELLRVKGDLLLLQGMPSAAERAADLFRQALDEARRHEALAWELRAATSLARLLRHQGRAADAACLQPIYDRFTEGFGTADLIAAKQFLGEAGDGPRH